jgi:PmbA protein
MENIEDYAGKLLNYARKSGADAADVVFVGGTNLSVVIRGGKQETLERSESSGIGLRVWRGKKCASVSTDDISETSLQELASRAVDMADFATIDEHNFLSDSDLWVKNIPDLQLADDFEPTANYLQELAQKMEQVALSQNGITNSEGADAGYSKSEFVLATSKGFMQKSRDTSFALSVSVLAGTGDKMERDYDYRLSRFASDLPSPESIGLKAAENAVARLNPRKKSTCKVPVVFDKRVSKDLLSNFAGSINGAAIVRGTSFLKDAMNQPIFSEKVNIFDDALLVRGLGSQAFDAEGVACGKLQLVENGVLKSWLLDLRSSSKLGLKTTGHASRGLGSNPSPSSTNLYMAAGKLSFNDMIADIDDGFYVTETFGMGINLITGDYSQGASGFWIEGGEIIYPVSELTIAGNLRDMLKGVSPANDLEFRYGKNAPTLRVDGMTVAGN